MSMFLWLMAAIGYVITAFKVLPHLWETDVLSCITVAISLFVVTGLCLITAFGRFP